MAKKKKPKPEMGGLVEELKAQAMATLRELRTQLQSTAAKLREIKAQGGGQVVVCSREDDFTSVIINSASLGDDVDFLLAEISKPKSEDV